MTTARSRAIYAGLAAATVVLGLASRSEAVGLPWWIAKPVGDALYAALAFWAIAFAWPRARTVRVAIAATAACFAIETLQLYRAPWIEAIRATTLGRLVLGDDFAIGDLARYLVGIAAAIAIDVGLQRRQARS